MMDLRPTKAFKTLVTFCLFLLSTSPSLAEFSWDHFKVVAGAQSSTLLQKRGIITYKGFQSVPILGVQLFHPDLLLTGSALYYQKFFNENWIFRSRLNINATADEPLFITSEGENDRVRREKTTELDVYLEYRWRNQSFLRFNYSQDLVAHKGYHADLTGRLNTFDFLADKFNPGLFATLGFGNSAHNQYLYGAGADNASASFFEYGLWVGSPKVIDVFWPTLKVSHFQILGPGNASAAFVTERSGWQATLLFAFQVFPNNAFARQQ